MVAADKTGAVVEPLVGSRRITVSFACNDPENGNFAERVVMCNFLDVDLEHGDCFRGVKFHVDDIGMRFRIHRVWFPFVRRINWYGNWCWDGFVMKRPQAIRLLKLMKFTGLWDCTGGPVRLCDWYEKK